MAICACSRMFLQYHEEHAHRTLKRYKNYILYRHDTPKTSSRQHLLQLQLVVERNILLCSRHTTKETAIKLHHTTKQSKQRGLIQLERSPIELHHLPGEGWHPSNLSLFALPLRVPALCESLWADSSERRGRPTQTSYQHSHVSR